MLVVGFATPALALNYETILGSVSVTGGPPHGISYHAQFSEDGRYLAFYSYATDVTTDSDTNGTYDCFVRDLNGSSTIRVSESTSGVQGNRVCREPRISGDGRYVAFQSTSSNLVAGDTNGNFDVFLRDTVANTTELVSATQGGGFPTGVSTFASLSDDGRYVAFQSSSSLAPGEGGAGFDIFVRDRQLGTTSRVTNRNKPSTNARISGNGRYVVYESPVDDVSQIFRFDRQTGTTMQVTDGNNHSTWPVVDAAGDTIAFPSMASDLISGDNNGHQDVFVYEVGTATTTMASVNSTEQKANKKASNQYGQTISPDGLFVTFNSLATNLVDNDTNDTWDIFVRDLQAGTTRRASKSSDGVEGNDQSNYSSVTSEGLKVGFQSDANNLIPGDRERGQDIFVNQRI
jgi:Tol biopolymer transport system component